ncbi:hypothetical protein [Bosea sp. (in: a-proteobacteria)]|jgi:hypothetical protein|uniref:hypothetical protein n=1 Tax=Bosea sp. (in: a-proteobacteria) TaxID=1871050 RepID=UPI002DDCA9C8|nr:hypothetical protein [Bosea sp. (in: a-proteobacteria)]HEV2512984.1 hypothetical protein [Bosea sp. (in: a-proteobacteria)]
MIRTFAALAAATIVAGAFASPAHAVRLRTQPNGPAVNGLVLNGLVLNGLVLNGKVINGRSWQGTSVRGAEQAEALSLIAVELAD